MKLVEEMDTEIGEVSFAEGAEAKSEGGHKSTRRKSGKKSRFLQKAKKFAKQGRLGRGFEVDTDTYNYFLGVLELSQKSEFETQEDRENFIENSFGQTDGNEVNLSSNQMTSRVLESLLPSASEGVLIRFTSAFTPSLRTICSDPFASHVLEKLLEVTSSDKWCKNDIISEWFKQTSKFVINNFEEFVFDPYANHVMRKVCQCLSGFVAPSGQHNFGAKGPSQQNIKKEKDTPVPDAMAIFGERKENLKNVEIFKNFFQRFLAWPQFFDLFNTELTCGCVQNLLKTYHRIDPEVAQEGVSRTIKAIGNDLDLNNATAANFHTRTIEVCLGIADESMWEKIYKRYFEGRLGVFGAHEKGKFCLKRVMESCPNKERFEKLFDEVQPELDKLYKADHFSVFVPLAEGCKKFQTKQTPFLQSITSILGYDSAESSGEADGASEKKSKKKSKHDKPEKKENFILCLARFGREMKLKDDGSPMFISDISGTMVLQHMLEFHKPFKIVSNIMEIEGPELSKLTQDPKGSHIVDTFFKSSTIGDKNKEKLLLILKDYMVPLALNKFGSRVIDVIWAWANIKNKGIVASGLVDRIAQLNANQYGKFIAEKCALRLYKRNPKEWAEAIEKADKQSKIVDGIVSELETPKGKKRKSKKHQDVEDENEDAQVTIKVEEVEAEEDQPKRKKKKKKSKKSDVDAEIDDVKVKMEEVEAEENEPKKKKKKKSKKSDVDSEEDNFLV